MSETNSDIHTDIQQLTKTTSLLSSLQAKLSQYMSRSRIVSQRVPTTMTFLLPSSFQFTDRSREIPSDQKSRNIKDESNRSKDSSQRAKNKEQDILEQRRDLNLIEEDIKQYQERISKGRSESGDKFQELYDNKAKRLQEEIEELSQRKQKIRGDRQILGKENRRLTQILKEKEKELVRVSEKQKKQIEKRKAQKTNIVEIKRKNVLVSLQKERLMGEQLEREMKELEYDLKLLDEKSITVEYDTKKTSKEREKSKGGVVKKKSLSSTAKNYPVNGLVRMKSGLALKTSKSKSMLNKKFK